MVALTARQALRGRMVDQLRRSMSPPDREVLGRPEVRDGLGRSLAESFRQGIGAATWDGVAVARGEGFGLQDIQTEVLIWHGGRDRNDPVAMARLQAQRLPHAKAVYYPDDGHLIFYSRIDEILPELTGS
jgi:pimeloyl-ACP methyl ester carboxylesterase